MKMKKLSIEKNKGQGPKIIGRIKTEGQFIIDYSPVFPDLKK